MNTCARKVVAEVRLRRTHHSLIDRVGRLVREDAGGKARHELLHLVNAAALHDVVVHECVVAVELHIVGQVVEQPTNKRSQVDDVCGLVLAEQTLRGGAVTGNSMFSHQVTPQ